MPWCPKCKAEYREGYVTCADCGEALLPGSPSSGGESPEPDPSDSLAVAAVVYDELTAAIMESQLRGQGIPFLRRYQGAGEVMRLYMGASFYGIELLVPEHQLPQALEVLGTAADPEEVSRQAMEAPPLEEEEWEEYPKEDEEEDGEY